MADYSLKFSFTGDSSQLQSQIRAVEQGLAQLSGKAIPDPTKTLQSGLDATAEKATKARAAHAAFAAEAAEPIKDGGAEAAAGLEGIATAAKAASGVFGTFKAVVVGIGSALLGAFGKGKSEAAKGLKETKGAAEESTGAFGELKDRLLELIAVEKVWEYAKGAVEAAHKSEVSYRALASAAASAGISITTAMTDAKKASEDGLISISAASKALASLYASGFTADQAQQMVDAMKKRGVYGRTNTDESLDDTLVNETDGIRRQRYGAVAEGGFTKPTADIEAYARAHGILADDIDKATRNQILFNSIVQEGSAHSEDAKTATEGFEGAMTRLERSSDSLKTKLGEALIPTLTIVAQLFGTIFDNFLKPLLVGLESMGVLLGNIAKSFINVIDLAKNRDLKAFKEAQQRNDEDSEAARRQIQKNVNGRGSAAQFESGQGHVDTARIADLRNELQKITAEGDASAAKQLDEFKKKVEEAIEDLEKKANKGLIPKADAELTKQALQTLQVDTSNIAGEVAKKDKEQRARDLADADTDAKVALTHAKANIEEENSTLEDNLAHRLVSQQSYIEQKAALQQKEVEQDRAALQARLAQLEGAQAVAVGPDEADKYKNQIKELHADLDALEAKHFSIKTELDIQRTDLDKELQDLNVSLKVKLLTAEGQDLNAKLAEIDEAQKKALDDPKLAATNDVFTPLQTEARNAITKTAALDRTHATLDQASKDENFELELRVKIADIHGNDLESTFLNLKKEWDAALNSPEVRDHDDKIALVNQYYGEASTKAQYDVEAKNASNTQSAYDVTKTGLQQQLTAGSISQLEYNSQIKKATLETADSLDKEAASMKKLADDLGNPQLAVAATKMAQQAQSLRLSLTQTSAQVNQSIADNGTKAFQAWVTGAEKGKDAFRSFGLGVLKTLEDIAIKMVETQIFKLIGGATGGIGGLIGSAVSSAGYATGGVISGPGTATSDSIPILASNGEAILNARAVAGLGKPLVDHLNATGGQLPVGRFAEGGIIGTFGGAVAAGQNGPQITRFITAFNENDIADAMRGSAGEKVVIHHIRNNAGSVNTLLGG